MSGRRAGASAGPARHRSTSARSTSRVASSAGSARRSTAPRSTSSHRPPSSAAAPVRRHRAAPTAGRRTISTGAPAHGARALQRRSIHAPRLLQHRFKVGQARRRLLAVFVIAAVVFTVIVARVLQLQTTGAAELRAAGQDQRTTQMVLRAQRGAIFDRNGDELAMSIPSTTVTANPKLVADPASTVAVLAQILGLPAAKQESLLDAFTRKEKAFVYVARQVPDEAATVLEELELNGVDLVAEDRRYMPMGEVGRSVLGRTDPDGRGIAGIEKQYDGLLTGVDGEMVRQHDRRGRSLPGTETTSVDPVPGHDIVLTLDRSVQHVVEQQLLLQVTTLGARGGTAVVLASKTGEVIAMASVRRSDTGEYVVSSGNLAAVDAAEPGSVVKAATIAAAMNEGVVTADTPFEIPWRKQYSDTMLHDAEQHPTGVWPVSRILAESSNIGTIEVMLRMGDSRGERKQKLHEYLRAFGLGEQTALEFPGESAGLMKDWTEWEGAEQYTMSYGQGLASTSIQLAAAINVIANDGVYVAPRLLAATIGPSGSISDAPASATHRVVRSEVAGEVTTMMEQVVCSGTATRAQVEGLSVAGKTGTGLKAQPNGTYYNELGQRTYYASFVGFFPAEDPQATVLVSIDEPPGADGQVTRFGGTAAAPVFAKIAPTIMREMKITPPSVDGGCPGG